MQRFILQANVERFESLLQQEWNETSREFLRGSLIAAKRELALLNAAVDGVRLGPAPQGSRLSRATQLRSEFQRTLEASRRSILLLEPGPGLHIVDVSDAYAEATMIDRAHTAGELMFDVFPDNPDDPLADGVNNLYTSLRRAAETRSADTMALQRYDIRDVTGAFVERYWRPVNTPVFDEFGHLVYIIHQVEDVTDEVIARRAAQALGTLSSMQPALHG